MFVASDFLVPLFFNQGIDRVMEMIITVKP